MAHFSWLGLDRQLLLIVHMVWSWVYADTFTFNSTGNENIGSEIFSEVQFEHVTPHEKFPRNHNGTPISYRSVSQTGLIITRPGQGRTQEILPDRTLHDNFLSVLHLNLERAPSTKPNRRWSLNFPKGTSWEFPRTKLDTLEKFRNCNEVSIVEHKATSSKVCWLAGLPFFEILRCFLECVMTYYIVPGQFCHLLSVL